MKLALRLVSIIVLAIVVAIAADGYFSFRRQVTLFERDMRADAQLLGHSLRILLTDVWQADGAPRALELIDDVNRAEHQIQVRWVWLDASPDSPQAPQMHREALEPVALGQEVHFDAVQQSGGEQLLTYVPVPVEKDRQGALELTQSRSAIEEFRAATTARTLRLTGATILASGLLTALLGFAMVGRPLRRLTEKARRIGAGDLSGPLRIRGHTELSDLAFTMNEMCVQLGEAYDRIRADADARIALIEQLRHADRLRTVGTLAAGVAHELGTPLNVVSGRARLIASGDLTEAEVAESADIVRAQSERMTGIIRQLLEFSRPPSAPRETVDLPKLAERCVRLLTPMARRRRATFRMIREGDPVMAWANAGELQQVLMNLIMNALQAMPQGGSVEVGIRQEHAQPPGLHGGEEGEWLCLWVRDEGEGIRDEDLDRLLEPFFTTKDVGEGTGLGLSIAHGIVRDHGGWIDVKSEVGKGSCFSVYLPQGGSR